jgi:predicted nucleic acid-binding protein
VSAYFLDTNALVYFYEGAPLGRALEAPLRVTTNRFYVTTLTQVEIRSALAKRVRSGDLDRAGYDLVMRRFLKDTSQSNVGTFLVHPLRHRFADAAARLIEQHALDGGLGLRTLDCLQLVAALDLKQREPDLKLVTADLAFAGVAELAGVPAFRLSAAGG